MDSLADTGRSRAVVVGTGRSSALPHLPSVTRGAAQLTRTSVDECLRLLLGHPRRQPSICIPAKNTTSRAPTPKPASSAAPMAGRSRTPA